MSTNKIDLVRAKIERRYKYNKEHENDWAGTSHFWQRKEDEEILSFIDSMQEEPKECMYSKDNYTGEDRKVLCDSCEEKCELNKKEEPVNNGLDLGCGVIWKDEEPLSEDFEIALEKKVREAQDWTYIEEEGGECPLNEEFGANDLEDFAKWGANWQKQQMMAKAIEGGSFSYKNGFVHISCDIDEHLTDIKMGDKVKVIIIKED